MAENSYDSWLCEKLRSLQLDEDVFLDYIKGVLEEDSTSEEKTETIENILQGATDESITDICNEILQKWSKISETKVETKPENNDQVDRDEKILDIIHRQQETLTISKPKMKDGDELKRKLLEQYSQISENEESDDEDEGHAKSSESANQSIFENLNAKSVVEQQKAQREKQKKASEEKREKDKANREAEKLKKQERQEKEKKRTQKGERRR